MSNINDKATVSLFVNGEQAQQAMARLSKEADVLRQSLQAALAAGDKKQANKLQRDLDKVTKELNRTESAAKGTGIVLKNLANTSIQGLNNALKYLERQLRNTKPDTESWKQYAEQIKAVKGRIAELKEEQDGGESMWTKFKNWSQTAWPAIDLLKQGYEAVVSSVYEYVDAYAQMDQEMANVRKFTGMTAEQVEDLNEEFKKMDTRSSREQLNQLAQEAGRLGKTSKEDILGYVRAADKINVALDELGEGATLTLSKLTGVFGLEDVYGTEKSLLKVGSVVNELSQNCSASASYLTDFANRMGGVGAQAGLTIEQIMGLGAVLDSNALNVESSATAVSQVLVRMMQDPAKYAKVAGLEIDAFADKLRTDANGALLDFLEKLNQAGGMDVLAPMFKDMGENGARAIASLSTLALHIDEVKTQQAAANVAFREGTSVGAEYSVQNNTVAAALEKCKNRANELKITLGEQLYPLASHFLTLSSALMRAIGVVVTVLVENKGIILSLGLAIAAYNIAVNFAIIKQKLWSAALIAWRAIAFTCVAASKLLVAVAALLSGNLVKARASWVAFSGALKLSPVGLLAAALTGVVALLVTFAIRASKATTEADRLAKAQKKIADAEEAAKANCTEELATLEALYKASQNQKLSLEQRLVAVRKLQELYPDYFKNLSQEAILAGNAADTYERLRKNIVRSAQAEARKSLLGETESEILKIKRQRDRDVSTVLESLVVRTTADEAYLANDDLREQYIYDHAEYHTQRRALEAIRADAKEKLDQLEKERELLYDGVSKDVLEDSDTHPTASPDITPTPTAGAPAGKDPSSNGNRFADEKAWREREEALARISYARGESTYSEHTARMSQIAEEYYAKMLAHTDLSEDERLKIEADYAEQINKTASDKNKARLEDENSSHQRLLDRLRTIHLARLSQENLSNEERERENANYEEAVEMSELEHLRRVRDLYEKGSAEWLEAQRALHEKELSAQERHQKEMEEKQKIFEELKKKYFGLNQPEKDEEFQRQFAALQMVYQQELAAVGDNEEEKLRLKKAFAAAEVAMRKEYNQEVADGTMNSFKDAILKAVAWLDSDGGKALTGTLSTVSSGLSSIFSGLSTMIQAEVDIQTAKIEEGYSREVELAQGNSYKVAKLEKKKEKEIAKVKSEANKKMFAMQVFQAVAQTAQNALAAYGSAAAIPVVGYILAPIAAAMAVAAGVIQVAAIKKQQKASEAQGYSQGGFTKPGGVNEPAGIVHAGEWVASQRLLSNPVARPMIEALDYAQRTNTIGSLRAEDVSRSITANNSLARIAESDGGSALVVAAAMKMSQTVDSLTERLNEPFVTVNTVTGDKGIKQAQDEYNRLLSNVTPKSKRR